MSEPTFDTLEAWIENKLPAIASEVDYPYCEEAAAELRLVVSRMLLETSRRTDVIATREHSDRFMAWLVAPDKMMVRTERDVPSFGDNAIVFERRGTKIGFIAELTALRDGIDRIIASS